MVIELIQVCNFHQFSHQNHFLLIPLFKPSKLRKYISIYEIPQYLHVIYMILQCLHEGFGLCKITFYMKLMTASCSMSNFSAYSHNFQINNIFSLSNFCYNTIYNYLFTILQHVYILHIYSLFLVIFRRFFT